MIALRNSTIRCMDKATRLTNFIIDIFLITIITIVIDIILILFNIYFTSFYFVMFLYYFILETYSGQTIGKRFTHTEVVNRNGTKPNFLKILMRTVLRLIPINYLSYLFGSEEGFHDKLSLTKLVKK
ncbi:MAG: RDD family protein [Winogradskyella sp.]|nr:RDD family protein [Winogradskyella sp.]